MTAPASRDSALDALRGLAVLGMVLSGSLGFGEALPAWMFHAQVPPPLHRFLPTLPGITWVDLVFPMFLFALGAALPLALRDAPAAAIWRTALRRGALLLYFAFLTQHAKPLPGAGAVGAVTALAAFALLGLQLVRGVPLWLKAGAWLAVAGGWAMLGFDVRRSDIILVVLAVMAFTGTLLWVATRAPGREPWRWWALAAVVAVMLAPPEAWTRLLAWTPADWAYRFEFLQYGLIVVPGMAAGQWLTRGHAPCRDPVLAVLALAIVAVNVALLHQREPGLNAALSGLLLAWGGLRARREGGFAAQAWPLAVALVVLGLLLEPLQGGIRKDPSTFSYQVLTAGLSLLLLVALQGLAGRWQAVPVGLGRNPMLAYVAGSLCVLPLLQLSGLLPAWSSLTATAPQALAKGLVFTAAVAAITLAANRLGWVWRA